MAPLTTNAAPWINNIGGRKKYGCRSPLAGSASRSRVGAGCTNWPARLEAEFVTARGWSISRGSACPSHPGPPTLCRCTVAVTATQDRAKSNRCRACLGPWALHLKGSDSGPWHASCKSPRSSQRPAADLPPTSGSGRPAGASRLTARSSRARGAPPPLGAGSASARRSSPTAWRSARSARGWPPGPGGAPRRRRPRGSSRAA